MIRRRKNLTQKNVAEAVGISESFYSLIENGLRRPSPNIAKLIDEALNFKEHGYDWTNFYTISDQNETYKSSERTDCNSYYIDEKVKNEH